MDPCTCVNVCAGCLGAWVLVHLMGLFGVCAHVPACISLARVAGISEYTAESKSVLYGRLKTQYDLRRLGEEHAHNFEILVELFEVHSIPSVLLRFQTFMYPRSAIKFLRPFARTLVLH